MRPFRVFFVPALIASLSLLFETSAYSASGFSRGREVAPFSKQFNAGDYIWHPEVSPAGPVVILVSLPDQVRQSIFSVVSEDSA